MSARPTPRLAGVLLLLSVSLWALGVCVGSSGFENLLLTLWDRASPAADRAYAWQIVMDIRLPRTLGAWTAGALLGLAGVVAQGLFRNPLADPYLLGSASGASLGVALALALLGGLPALLGEAGLGARVASSLFTGHWGIRLGLTGAAFVGAVGAVLLTLTLAKGVAHTLRLLLAGVIVGVVLGAAASLIMLYSPDSLQAMQAFLLGSTAFISWNAWGLMAGVWLLLIVLAWFLARMLDGLSLGENTALSLGLPLAPLRAALVGVLALATATAVAQTGLIAFVGLAAPHLVRAVVQVSYREQVWLASGMGGVLLVAADILARALIAPQELPVGVLTALLGGGYLLWLMHRRSAPTATGGL